MSLSNRYLIWFSYVGTRFSGVAKQLNTPLTVANVIETGIDKLKNLCEINSKLNVSSRTDAGVHALSNTADIILKTDNSDHESFCETLKDNLNDLYINDNQFVRILKIQKVNHSFSSRRAISRTYLYKLALLKNGKKYWNDLEACKRVDHMVNSNQNVRKYVNRSPLSNFFMAEPFFYPLVNYASSCDADFVTELREPFDYDLFLKATSLFNGQHNFSAFTTTSGREDMIAQNKNPVKTVKLDVEISDDQFMKDHLHQSSERYTIINVEISAESFLYKMIRKMIGTAVDAASGRISTDQISSMMENPADYYREYLTGTILKPHGLYLKQVNYDPEYLKLK